MEFLLRKLNTHMNTNNIFDALAEITDLISILKDAVDNRLREVGYDEDNYDWEKSSDECDDLLSMKETLSLSPFSITFISLSNCGRRFVLPLNTSLNIRSAPACRSAFT